MNGKQIRKVKNEVCAELNQIEVRYDMTKFSFDIESKDLILKGLSECMKDLYEGDGEVGDYEIVATGIRFEILKKN